MGSSDWTGVRYIAMGIDACLREILQEIGADVPFVVNSVRYFPDTGKVEMGEPFHRPAHVLQKYFDVLTDNPVPFPDDSLEPDAWKLAFVRYDEFRWNVKNAIQDGFESEKYYPNHRLFLSSPREQHGGLLSYMIAVKQSAYERYQNLSEESHHRYGLMQSLLRAIIETLLEEVDNLLDSREVTRHLQQFKIPALTTLRKAGAFFVRSGSYPGGIHAAIRVLNEGGFEFYEACNQIAGRRYEGIEASGGIVLAAKDLEGVEVITQFVTTVKITQHRSVRKLLELCQKFEAPERDLYLVCDGIRILGLGRIDQRRYDPKRCDTFLIRFRGHDEWDFLHDEKEMMRVVGGQPKLPSPMIDPEKLRTEIGLAFPGIAEHDREHLVELIREASLAGHGTTIAISNKAVEEIADNRLGRQCIKIRPQRIDAKLLRSLSSIDGAVMMDQFGICRAIGVILDGVATGDGDPERGARHNSTRIYANHHGDGCLLIVISEDKTASIELRRHKKPEATLDFAGMEIDAGLSEDVT